MSPALTSSPLSGERIFLCLIIRMEKEGQRPRGETRRDKRKMGTEVERRGETVCSRGTINSLLIPNNSDYTDE
jgi:hypothetical protein